MCLYRATVGSLRWYGTGKFRNQDTVPEDGGWIFLRQTRGSVQTISGVKTQTTVRTFPFVQTWTICINILKLLDICYVILGEEEWEEECGEEPPDGAVSGSTVDDMLPSTAGEECSPVATVTGSSSSPPPSVVRQSNGDIVTNNNDKGRKRILARKILTLSWQWIILIDWCYVSESFTGYIFFLILFLVRLSRRTLHFEIGYARLCTNH